MITLEQRWELARPYIDSANTIANKTCVALARDYWHYAQTCGVVVYPESTQGNRCAMRVVQRIAEGSGRIQYPLFILPLVQEDAAVGANIARTCAGSGSAAYYSDANLIVLRTWYADTPFIRGCELLHELGHAIRAKREGRVGIVYTDLARKAAEEVDMYGLIADLWFEQGGQPYQILLEKIVQYLHRILGGRPLFRHIIAAEEWVDDLDVIFGTALTDATRLTRLGDVVVFAYMQYYRQYHAGDLQHLLVQLMTATTCAKDT